jgi:hypothetical protein
MRIIVSFLLIIIGISLWALFDISDQNIYMGDTFPDTPPWHKNDPSQKIASIDVTALYFIPPDNRGSQYPDWEPTLDRYLSLLDDFHDLQFRGRSNINYYIHPDVVIGEKTSELYDSHIALHGSDDALQFLKAELTRRFFSPEGDMYNKDLVSTGDAYHVFVVLYEGRGASGGSNIAITSRSFLTDSNYKDISGSIFDTHLCRKCLMTTLC